MPRRPRSHPRSQRQNVRARHPHASRRGGRAAGAGGGASRRDAASRSRRRLRADRRRRAGRVIVTGMGKSGHIGAKIAATLASTGTPAFFVHPAEASHGDLGMITRDDVVLALSWSGETAELRSIVFYSGASGCRSSRSPRAPNSTLARSADVALILPRVEEACPHGLAPTTSTLIQLALGDALAIALLEARGFTADDFFKFHPGGSLGANLAHVRDVMHRGERLPLAPLGTLMKEALLLICREGLWLPRHHRRRGRPRRHHHRRRSSPSPVRRHSRAAGGGR